MVLVNKWRRAVSLGFVLALGLIPSAPVRAQDPDKTPPPAAAIEENRDGDPNVTPNAPGRPAGRFLIGDPAPDVRLRDGSGRDFHLSAERRGKPWLLVFVRRASEVADIEAAAIDLAADGLGTAVVAPFGAEKVGPAAATAHLSFLFDRASMTARTYGVYDPLTSNPRSGAFLVDRRGRFVWMVSGGLPSSGELVRMTREALEAQAKAQAEAAAK